MESLLYKPKTCSPSDYRQKGMECFLANGAEITRIENAVRENDPDGLLYRFIVEPVADGKAVYQIIKVNKRSVRIRLCQLDGCYGPDYFVPQWGDEAVISIDYAQAAVRRRDASARIFGENRK